ncbi:hypothetical protein [Ectothiorhodospira lacustris]|uniref:hypothetical protein n=1 Tax=Ectothiorhodospira lacustris TaxID=2899127 RepID=UPI001EE99E1E|nr:hypothetical protein [Ectothiorhodospira lacustris]MCG5501703.1 hypothetical protein [Ectothiorhodospira lacustris]MCG5510253.1 hypothetical protein [Ectothiorhodospira lacustris]MCG5521880.1 hypothetical protein [Ectothiorhodospira lacustris]
MPHRHAPHALWALALSAILMMPSLALAQAVPTLDATTQIARAGYYQLRWGMTGADGAVYRLEESRSMDFSEPQVLYEGADRATVISGRSDGTFHYRVQATLADDARSDWSPPLTVEVRHHALYQALALFGVGAFVFLATIALIVTGRRD